MTNFQDLQGLLTLSLSIDQVVKNMVVALACGLLIALFYGWITGRPAHSRTFVSSLIALSLITAVVIMVVGNNLARAFGLVGAMSIVRFRTAVKDVQDIVFIFFSLAIGMAAGVGLAAVAFIGTTVIGLVLTAISHIQLSVQQQREYLLQLSYQTSDSDQASYLPLLEQYCRRHQLINVKSFGEDDLLDLSFYIRLRDQDRSNELISALSRAEGVQNANLFLDEEYS
ncbi:MAG: DUF4956 domain-containing protein [Gemmatimonadetes bacterium]|jgi:uncharacterized membrane protein YhiD involved in acid resistance|nr:DUF4956 domain-containing protein [Gemmatimonadota bacterium]